MRLIHTDVNGGKHEVKVGYIFSHGLDELQVTYMPKPHEASSSGKVNCYNLTTGQDERETFCHVYDMEWIEREDRGWKHPDVKRKQVIELAAEVMGRTSQFVYAMSDEAFYNFVRSIDLEHLQYYPTAIIPLTEWLKEQRNA